MSFFTRDPLIEPLRGGPVALTSPAIRCLSENHATFHAIARVSGHRRPACEKRLLVNLGRTFM
jgi:hypothetical protein